jgi:hypothetical protein
MMRKRESTARPDLRHVGRKPAAILHSAAGYSRLMSGNEGATLRTPQASRVTAYSLITRHRGLS